MATGCCGLVVDVARVCQVVTVRPWQNSSSTTQLRYFFVADDTPVVPYVHHYPSPTWDARRVVYPSGIGYVSTYNPKVTSRPPAVTYRGRVCGSQQLWEEGPVLGRDAPLATVFGHAACCLLGPLQAGTADGAGAGGSSLAATAAQRETCGATAVGTTLLTETALSADAFVAETIAAAAVGQSVLVETVRRVESCGAAAVGTTELGETAIAGIELDAFGGVLIGSDAELEFDEPGIELDAFGGVLIGSDAELEFDEPGIELDAFGGVLIGSDAELEFDEPGIELDAFGGVLIGSDAELEFDEPGIELDAFGGVLIGSDTDVDTD